MKTRKESVKVKRRTFLAGAGILGASSVLAGCSLQPTNTQEEPEDSRNPHQYDSLLIDMSHWSYDAEHDLYYLLDVPYCQNPVSKEYQTISLYMPGAYFSSEKNGETYTCSLQEDAKVGHFQAGDITCIFPINCAQYGPQRAEQSFAFDGLKPYLATGALYVVAGCRGRSQGFDGTNAGNGLFEGGLPATVIDLKAAIRFLRLNKDRLGISNICAFGVGQGGFLATLLGVSGNAEVFQEALDKLGAASWNQELETTGDNLDAVCAWTPELSLANQDSAYEWLFGQYTNDASRKKGQWTASLSNDLAKAWAADVNEKALETSLGEKLQFEATSGGVFVEGSAYHALLKEAERSAEDFFANASFPLTLDGSISAKAPFPGDAKDSSEEALEAQAQDAAAAFDSENSAKNSSSSAANNVLSGTFRSPQAYVRALNQNKAWLSYASQTDSVHIDSLRELALHYAHPNFSCTAFDGLEAKTVQNQLFGVNGKESLHFSRLIADLLTANMSIYAGLSNWSDAYTLAWATDLETEDASGNTVFERAQAVDQSNYLSKKISAEVAPKWRLRVGLQQGEIPWSQTFFFAKELETYDSQLSVDYASSWRGGINLCEVDTVGIEPALSWLEDSFGIKE